MIEKEREMNSHRLEDTKETRKCMQCGILFVSWDRKRPSGKLVNMNRIFSKLTIQCYFLSFDHCAIWVKVMQEPSGLLLQITCKF